MEIDVQQTIQNIKDQPQYVLVGSGLIALGIICLIVGIILLF